MREPIIVDVPASVYKGSYKLTWNFDTNHWERTEGDEPAIGYNEFMRLARKDAMMLLGITEYDLWRTNI